MKRKRFLVLALCLALCVGALLALSACGGGGDDTELPKIEGVTFKGATYDWDGTAKKIEVQGLPEGATVTYSPGNSYTNAGTYSIKATVKLEGYEDLELVAKLVIKPKETEKKVSVTFDPAGATTFDGDTLVEVVSGQPVGEPTSILRNGYSFLGWYNGDVKWDFSKAVDADMVLTAKWNLLSYTITYVIEPEDQQYVELPKDPTDPSLLANPTNYTVESDEIVLVGAIIKSPDSEKSFDYWYAKSAGQEIRIDKIPKGSTLNLTLYAKLRARVYEVTYDTDGGTNDSGNITEYDIDTPSFTLLPATKEHYEFKSWVDENNNPVTSIAGGVTADITLKATYTPAPYDIEYVLGGGTNNTGNPATYHIEESVTLLGAKLSGHKFIGWYTENNTTSTKVETIPVGTTGKITLYAQWQEYDCKISYVAMGGTLPAENPTGFDPEEGVASFNPATRLGNTFDGWYTSLDYTTRIESIPAGSEQSYVLYAKFVEGTEGLTYTLSGSNYTVSGYTGTDTDVYIPAAWNGKNVTAIAENAFKGKTAVTKINLTSTLTSIGANAFEGCTALADVTIPASVTTIGANAFYGCTALEVINCKALSKPTGYNAAFNKLNTTDYIEVKYAYTSEEDNTLPVQPLT